MQMIKLVTENLYILKEYAYVFVQKKLAFFETSKYILIFFLVKRAPWSPVSATPHSSIVHADRPAGPRVLSSKTGRPENLGQFGHRRTAQD